MSSSRQSSLLRAVHGPNPQSIMEKIMRLRIRDSRFWKEHCFGLTADLLVDKAVRLKYFGGMMSDTNVPTPFLCLLLKMLQLTPEIAIVKELLSGGEDFKYVRLLAAYYLRMTGTPLEIYSLLEPLYRDYRKVRKLTKGGWQLLHVDEVIHELLTQAISLNMALPKLPARALLEDAHLIGPYRSLMSADISDSEEEG